MELCKHSWEAAGGTLASRGQHCSGLDHLQWNPRAQHHRDLSLLLSLFPSHSPCQTRCSLWKSHLYLASFQGDKSL